MLIKKQNYSLILILDDLDFDYYTDISIELFSKENRIILYCDNLLALKNIVEQYNKGIPILNNDLEEERIGLLLNKYYQGLYENVIKNEIILDKRGQWIGEKYLCYVNSEFATWIYRYNNRMVFRITPIFQGFEKDNYIQDYNQFMLQYKDILKDVVSVEELEGIKKIICELCNKFNL